MRFILSFIISLTIVTNAYSSECDDSLARAAYITNLTVLSAGATVVTQRYWKHIRSGYERVRNFVRSQLPWGSPFHEMAYKIFRKSFRNVFLAEEVAMNNMMFEMILSVQFAKSTIRG